MVFTHLLDQNGQPIEDIETYGNSHPSQLGDENRSLDSKFNPLRTTNSSHNGGTTSHSCSEVLSYGGAGGSLCVPFQPEKLCMLPEGGRVYHAGKDKLEGVGLVKSSLAIELSRFFVYEEGASDESSSPVWFRWRGTTWTIDGSTVQRLRELKVVEK